MSQPRSWLFVPADSEKKIAKALDCPVDALFVPELVHGSRTVRRAA